jgi:hypothetical protein
MTLRDYRPLRACIFAQPGTTNGVGDTCINIGTPTYNPGTHFFRPDKQRIRTYSLEPYLSISSPRSPDRAKSQMNAPNQPWTWSTTQGDGYPALADFLAQDPDHETFVFRKFKKLAVRNALYLQGELTALEEEVETLAKSDDPEVHLSMRSWKTLDENAQRPGREKSLEFRLRDVMNGLDGKLKTYCSLVFWSLGLEDISLLIALCEKMRLSCSSATSRCSNPRVLESSRRCVNGCMALHARRIGHRSLTDVKRRCSASGQI